jgi:hypothetical protein
MRVTRTSALNLIQGRKSRADGGTPHSVPRMGFGVYLKLEGLTFFYNIEDVYLDT